MSDWIRTRDRLPEVGSQIFKRYRKGELLEYYVSHPVLVYSSVALERAVACLNVLKDKRHIWIIEESGDVISNITHWVKQLEDPEPEHQFHVELAEMNLSAQFDWFTVENIEEDGVIAHFMYKSDADFFAKHCNEREEAPLIKEKEKESVDSTVEPEDLPSYSPGSIGEVDDFTEKFCTKCDKDMTSSCEIRLQAIVTTIGSFFPTEWQYDSDNEPCCTEFNLIEEIDSQY